jgi:hypothetical protein
LRKARRSAALVTRSTVIGRAPVSPVEGAEVMRELEVVEASVADATARHTIASG